MARKKIPQGELGYTGLSRFYGLVSEHWISALNTSAKRVEKYDEIYRYDPTASAMVKTTQMFMCGSQPRVETAGVSKVDMGATDFLVSCLTDMTKSWQEIMSDIVLFLVYGFFDMELVYWRRDGTKSDFDDGRIGWRKWAPRHPVTLHQWVWDENGGLQAMIQQGPPDYKTVTIPIEKMLHFTTSGMGKNNPEGVSVLEGAYRPFFYSKNLEVIEGILAERASGSPVIELPEGADTSNASDSDLSVAKKIVRNVKVAEDMGITLPYGFKFYYQTPTSGPAINIGEIITRHRRDMARVLMMDFIMLGGGDQGSWAMHKDKSMLYIRSLNSFLKKVADVINRHGVPRLFALNAFPGITGLPKIYFTPITKIDIGDFAEVIARLFNSGAVSYDMGTENAVRREVGLPEITEPGLTFKPPMPLAAGPPQEEKPKGEEEKEGEEEEPEEESEMAEFAETSGRMGYHDAVAYVDGVAQRILRDYDAIARELAEELAGTNTEEEWEDIVDAALLALSGAMIARLRSGMFYIWNQTTGSYPGIEGLRAILNELEFQNQYIQDSLGPAIKEKVLAERRQLKRDAAKAAAVVLGIIGILGAFRYRTSTYAGGTYKLWGNMAHPSVLFREMEPVAKKAGMIIHRDWRTGHILGEGVLAAYEGPADEQSCEDCLAVIALGFVDPSRIPPIGSLQCGPNCRCHTIYKLRGRIYR